MSTDQNKELVRRVFEEGINRKNLAYFDEAIGENYVNHSMPAPAPGREGFKQIISSFVAGFPDMQITLEDVIADGDRVATRGFWTGTHSGDFMGIPATGRPVNLPFIDIWRIENGKAVENWVQMDMMALMQQLGVMQEPAAAEDNKG